MSNFQDNIASLIKDSLAEQNAEFQKQINELEKEITELKEYYPIPNMFMGFDEKESIKHRNKLIAENKHIIKCCKSLIQRRIELASFEK
jgi:sugar-specific transcriptional regulator TrmB